MDERGQHLSIKERMMSAEYNNFLACENALIHSYEEGKRLRSSVFDQKGGSLVDLKRTIELSEIVKKNGIAYHELGERLRRAIEYFGLQEFFGVEAGTSSFDSGKTEIVVRRSEEETGPNTSLFGKVKRLFKK